MLKSKVSYFFLGFLSCLVLTIVSVYLFFSLRSRPSIAETTAKRSELVQKVSDGVVRGTIDVIEPVVISYLPELEKEHAKQVMNKIKDKAQYFKDDDLAQYNSIYDKLSIELKDATDQKGHEGSARQFVSGCEEIINNIK